MSARGPVRSPFFALALASLASCDGDPSADDTGTRAPDAFVAPGVDAGPLADAWSATDAPSVDRDAGSIGTGELPSGATGIASRHPGDEGIASDPDVLFSDDFESYASVDELWGHWTNFFGGTSLTTRAEQVHAGHQALQFELEASDVEHSDGVEHALPVEQDTVFLRWYQRLDPSYDVVGSSHQGGGISAHYEMDGHPTPGIPADGTNKYLATMEMWRGADTDPSPGALNVYIYHPAQRDVYGDHFFPNGEVLPNTSIPGDFGPSFMARPNVTPELGRWYCFELMVHANTPGLRDGRIAMWLDGALVGDFPSLRLRDVPTLTIDRVSVMFHARAVPVTTHKWIDDVVVATGYVGPRS
ncbi:MAG: hypothetical protein U0353_28675 [Sandaracinus sp.]